jgi:alpha-mannosidase
MMPGLADYLAAPPLAYAHLPYDSGKAPSVESLITLAPASIRLLACKRSWDGEALIVRLQEAVGRKTRAALRISLRKTDQEQGHVPQVLVPLSFQPFEIKTLRVGRDGTWSEVRMIEEAGE